MKTTACPALLLGLLLFQTIVAAEESRRTTDDFYGAGYATQTEEQIASGSAAEARAEAYRHLYE